MPLFPILFILIIAVLTALGAGPIAAVTGGWAKLARIYPASRPFAGKKFVASGAMGIANYGFSLLLGADPTGLFLETTGFVRTGHVPLFIPWTELTARETAGLFSKIVRIEFRQAPGVVLRVAKKTALQIKEGAGVPVAFPGLS